MWSRVPGPMVSAGDYNETLSNISSSHWVKTSTSNETSMKLNTPESMSHSCKVKEAAVF